MKTLKFYGNEYNLFIVSDKVKNIFFIKALHKKTKRYSSINNLNYILPELNINTTNQKSSDSQWELSRKEINNFVKKITNPLGNKKFLEYLENQLNLDRIYGEWKNKQRIPNIK